jgi:hypothetical protein
VNPQQPYQPPVTPQWPGAGPYPGPAPTRPASGGTGVVGGLLAVVAGLALLIGMIWQIVQMGGLTKFALSVFAFQSALALQGLEVVLLIAGGALLCLRVGAGRFLMLAGTVLVLVHLGLTFAEVNGFITTVAVFHAVGLQDVAMLTILLSLVSSLLGLLPSTARWVSTLRT